MQRIVKQVLGISLGVIWKDSTTSLWISHTNALFPPPCLPHCHPKNSREDKSTLATEAHCVPDIMELPSLLPCRLLTLISGTLMLTSTHCWVMGSQQEWEIKKSSPHPWHCISKFQIHLLLNEQWLTRDGRSLRNIPPNLYQIPVQSSAFNPDTTGYRLPQAMTWWPVAWSLHCPTGGVVGGREY